MEKGRASRYLRSTDASLLAMSAPSWAWEFLRNSPQYRDDATRADVRRTLVRRKPAITIIEDERAANAAAWGLCFFTEPSLPATKSIVAWRPEICSSVLAVSTARAKANGIDFCKLGISVAVVKAASIGEHVLLFNGIHSLQLHVLNGTVLDGPLDLKFQVESVAAADQKIAALNRLLTLLRKGFLPAPLLPPRRTAHRWLLALKALPHAQAGLSDREIAAKLFPDHETRRWNDANDWLRTQVRRARTLGQTLVDGEYRKLVSWGFRLLSSIGLLSLDYAAFLSAFAAPLVWV